MERPGNRQLADDVRLRRTCHLRLLRHQQVRPRQSHGKQINNLLQIFKKSIKKFLYNISQKSLLKWLSFFLKM